jgi:hypothetical protein
MLSGYVLAFSVPLNQECSFAAKRMHYCYLRSCRYKRLAEVQRRLSSFHFIESLPPKGIDEKL